MQVLLCISMKRIVKAKQDTEARSALPLLIHPQKYKASWEMKFQGHSDENV